MEPLSRAPAATSSRMDYSYSFSPELEQEWTWTERYATQPEILRYAEPRRRPLRPAPRRRSSTPASTAADVGRGDAALDGRRPTGGDTVSARFLRHGGRLPVGREDSPRSPASTRFAGPILPHRALAARAASTSPASGSASSAPARRAIQSIPLIAEAGRRTSPCSSARPSFAMPAATRHWTTSGSRAAEGRLPRAPRALREAHGAASAASGPRARRWRSTADERERAYAGGVGSGHAPRPARHLQRPAAVDPDANETAAEFVRAASATSSTTPSVADAARPATFPFGTKRPCLDTGYYATFNRPNVRLVDLRATPIDEIEPDGVRTSDGLHEFDVLVFATGFDAMTGRCWPRSTSAAATAARCARRGPTGRGPTSASPSPGSRTCSRSPDRAAPRCWPT